MPLQVLPLGVTSAWARRTPSFNAPRVAVTPGQEAPTFTAAALRQDPRRIIDPSDVYTLRQWYRAVVGSAWDEKYSLDDLMAMGAATQRNLYKAVCLYLQGKYWGALPDDWSGPSDANSPAVGWPANNTPVEQRVFTWKLEWAPTGVPDWMGEDALHPGTAYFPIIRPGMLIQKFDGAKWRVLNTGGTDRDFNLAAPGGIWDMRGWDFGDWLATNADFLAVFKILGFGVVAVAAVVTGGSALIAGEGLFAAAGAAGAAASAANQIVTAVDGFVDGCARQDFGAALGGLGRIANVGFGVNLSDIATYQPGIDQLAQVGDTLKPYIMAVVPLGGDTGAQLLKTVAQAGRDVKSFVDNTEIFLAQLSVDATRTVTGLFPDALLRALPSMPAEDIGRISSSLFSDYTNRARQSIASIQGQIPPYLKGWADIARNDVKRLGYDAAVIQQATPQFAKPAYDAGLLIGALEARVSNLGAVDINALTPKQKRALFFGDTAQICGMDPGCIRNAAEFSREADLFWSGSPGSITDWADRYGLRPLAERIAKITAQDLAATATVATARTKR